MYTATRTVASHAAGLNSGPVRPDSEPSGDNDVTSVGIRLVVVLKKLHMPHVSDSFVRARGAAASASEKAAPLLKKSVKGMRTGVKNAYFILGGLDTGMMSFWDRHDPGAHAAFVRWRKEHPDWYVLNCNSGSAMTLHKLGCSAFDFHSSTRVSLTRNRKICSSDRDQLTRWAHWQWGVTLKDCSLCKP